MIDIKITGTLPVIKNDPLPDAMQQISDYMETIVLKRLAMGGNPAWPLKKDGSVRYAGSRMASTVRKESTSYSASVIAGEGMISKKGFFYPWALHEGFTSPAVEGKLMVFEIDGNTIFTYKRKGFTVPPAPFMFFSEEDKEQILNIFPQAIFKGIEHEPING